MQACLGAARPARGLLLPASAGFESPVWHGIPRARRHRRLFEVAEVDLAHLHGQRRWRDIGGFGGGELEQPRGHGGAPSGLYRAAQWAGLSSCEYRAAQSRQARPEEAQEHLGAGAELLRCQGGTSTLSVLWLTMMRSPLAAPFSLRSADTPRASITRWKRAWSGSGLGLGVRVRVVARLYTPGAPITPTLRRSASQSRAVVI